VTFLEAVLKHHAPQPDRPATGTCHGRDVVGWAWNGRGWWPACAQDMPAHPNNRIYNSEFQEDW